MSFGRTYLGSLDLLGSEEVSGLFDTGGQVMRGTGGPGGRWRVNIRNESCDLVIMNPPWTRPTNHKGVYADQPVPSFAGFANEEYEQQAMSEALKHLRGGCSHLNAGLGTPFIDLAHKKLKPGGVLALVLPYSFVQGHSWKGCRGLIAQNYRDVLVVSIAATGSTNRAFAADTGMADCLVLATKQDAKGDPRNAVYLNLRARPSSLLEAHVLSTRLPASKMREGSLLKAGGSAVLSSSVSRAATGFENGSLTLPRQQDSIFIPVTSLGNIADRGLVHRDINGKGGRGAFDICRLQIGDVPTYPALWNHKAKRERRLIVLPDKYGKVRSGCTEKAVRIWGRTASRLHSNLDFQLNSQPLAMCLTPEKCIGGTAWPNVIPAR